MEERLQKLLSAAGVCSRRTAETYLIAGRVTVNGQTAHLGQRADPDRDEILVDGHPLAPRAEAVYILLNKPRGYVSTLSDERGRRTVAELVADCGSRVYPVGRLDLDSEGLLLLTNDGAWAQHLLHPKHEVEKTPPHSGRRLPLFSQGVTPSAPASSCVKYRHFPGGRSPSSRAPSRTRRSRFTVRPHWAHIRRTCRFFPS